MQTRPPLIFICFLVVALASPASVPYAATSNLVHVSAAIVSKGNCTFINNSAALNFGTLNPLDPQDVTVDTDQLSFVCRGGGNTDITYAITLSDSLYGNPTAPAMQHQSGIHNLPYQLSLDPAGGTIAKNDNRQLVVTGTVRGDDYKIAPAGAYTDTATLTIAP